MKHLANILSISRMLLSPLLLAIPLSDTFFAVYLFCGLTDMVDGTVARKTGSANSDGAKLDSIADFVFFLVCCLKLLPHITLRPILWVWIAMITLFRICHMCMAHIYHLSLHTISDKISGFLLFLFPLFMSSININLAAILICSVATWSIIQE